MKVGIERVEVNVSRCCDCFSAADVKFRMIVRTSGEENSLPNDSCSLQHIQTNIERAVSRVLEKELNNKDDGMDFECYRIQTREDSSHAWTNVLVDYSNLEEAAKAYNKLHIAADKRIVHVWEDVCCSNLLDVTNLASGDAEKSSND